MENKIGWSKDCEKALDIMMETIKKTIILDAESYAHFAKMDIIDFPIFEIALYKSICTLNKTNHAIIIQKFGMEKGMLLIESLEKRADADVSKVIIENLKNSSNISPEIKDMIKDLDDLMRGKNPESPTDFGLEDF